MRSWLIVAALGISCAPPGPPPAPAPSPAIEPSEPPEASPADELQYVMCVTYSAMSHPPPPPEIAQAAQLFDRADELGEANQWRGAAEAYLRAAELLRNAAERGSTHEDVVDYNRRVAYGNAALAYLNAGAKAAAHEALLEAATRDKLLSDALRAAAAVLPGPPPCDLEL